MNKVADLARLFDVNKETIKKWCFKFGEHLSPSATVKGQTRFFNEIDLRVFALVNQYWEDDPDYENIHACLNSGCHYSEEYIEFSQLNTSIFQDVTECEYEGDEAWTKGLLLGGMASKNHQIEIARSYKNAADELVEIVRKSHEPYDLAYPIFFSYRHTLELYLKVIGQYNPEKDKKWHYIDKLIDKIEMQYNEKIPQWMRNRLYDFHIIDPSSTSFRDLYEIPIEIQRKDEIWIDFTHLKVVMDKLCIIFEDIIGNLNL